MLRSLDIRALADLRTMRPFCSPSAGGRPASISMPGSPRPTPDAWTGLPGTAGAGGRHGGPAAESRTSGAGNKTGRPVVRAASVAVGRRPLHCADGRCVRAMVQCHQLDGGAVREAETAVASAGPDLWQRPGRASRPGDHAPPVSPQTSAGLPAQCDVRHIAPQLLRHLQGRTG